MTPRWVKATDGLELAVYEAGDPGAATIVAIHGYPDNASVWDGVIELLSQKYHVVSYDVRGAGRSGTPGSRAGYRLDQLEADFNSVIEAVSPDRPVHLLAHDWGSIQGWQCVTSDTAAGPDRQLHLHLRAGPGAGRPLAALQAAALPARAGDPVPAAGPLLLPAALPDSRDCPSWAGAAGSSTGCWASGPRPTSGRWRTRSTAWSSTGPTGGRGARPRRSRAPTCRSRCWRRPAIRSSASRCRPRPPRPMPATCASIRWRVGTGSCDAIPRWWPRPAPSWWTRSERGDRRQD